MEIYCLATPETSLQCQSPCLLKPPPPHLEWSASVFGHFLPSLCRGQCQISARELPSLWTNSLIYLFSWLRPTNTNGHCWLPLFWSWVKFFIKMSSCHVSTRQLKMSHMIWLYHKLMGNFVIELHLLAYDIQRESLLFRLKEKHTFKWPVISTPQGPHSLQRSNGAALVFAFLSTSIIPVVLTKTTWHTVLPHITCVPLLLNLLAQIKQGEGIPAILHFRNKRDSCGLGRMAMLEYYFRGHLEAGIGIMRMRWYKEKGRWT